MSISHAEAIAEPFSQANVVVREKRYLFGPVNDFFLLGGSTFIILPFLAFLPVDQYKGMVAATTLIISNFINYPHFAHSYQIFYRNFWRKAFGSEYSLPLRTRYIIAGLVVPGALIWFFVVSGLRGDAKLLAYAGNAMFFFVGWHYVKQGYGMLMLDAALKRQYFNNTDKKVLLANSYAIWILSWLNINAALAKRELFGLNSYSFHVPQLLLTFMTALAIAIGFATLWIFARRWKANGGTLPLNGIMAYLVTLYSWQLFARVHPLWMFIIPALHSLQYLAVVWRYETNYEKQRKEAAVFPSIWILNKCLGTMYRVRVAAFILLGCILGFSGFLAIPLLLESSVRYDQNVFGTALFLFVFFVFINVHHYFLDNVMWRRENADMRYLFG
jgi:hypothetical protein